MTAQSLGLTEFRTGDVFCGTSSTGAIEVYGTSGTQQRDLVPARLNGTNFVIPLLRANPQVIYVQTLGQPSVVSLRLAPVNDSSDSVDEILYLGMRDVGSFNIQAAGSAVRISATAVVLVSVASAAAGSDGTPPLAGAVDYTPVPPVDGTVYGFPNRGVLTGLVPAPGVLTCVNGTANATGSGTFPVSFDVGRFNVSSVVSVG